MPPPNITGQLHLGHAMFLTLQDIKTRHHALIGDDALWLPGTDHAGLATHAKILEDMSEQGQDTGDREAYLASGWAWKEKYHARITHQIKRTGASCDWGQERFTLDDTFQASAREAFKRCWDAGLIYREDEQWWMKMDAMAQPLIDAINTGYLSINPTTSANELLPMLEHIRPWCLSRQISWGMQIPLKNNNGEWLFDEGEHTPGILETDTLDTWFLSALWPFAALGWPDQTKMFDQFYPGEWMETGDDILFFWCARMWMMGYFLTKKWPFKKLFLHGLILDKNGKKMSKSSNSGIDPLDLINQYGADALRWHLAMRAEPGKNMKFSAQSCAADSKWINKIWHAGRFLGQFGAADPCGKYDGQAQAMLSDLTCLWADCLETDRFPDAARLIQAAFRDGFCGQWIETNKNVLREGDREALQLGWALYRHYLALLHPFLPFLTTDLHARIWGEQHNMAG